MRKLGRRPRIYNHKVPSLTAMLGGKQLPAPAPSVNYLSAMPSDLGALANNWLGCCTCAAFYHAIQVWTFNANPPMITWPTMDVIDLYSKACGYVQWQPATDQGGVVQDVLGYISKTGAPIWKWGDGVDKLAAFVEIDVKDTDNVKRCTAEFGVSYLGMSVPAFIMNQDNPPAVWDVDPKADNSIVGGHAVVAAGYDSTGLDFISWGTHYRLTWGFFAQFVDECYALASADWINAKGTAPCGLTLAQLEAAMTALKS